MQIDREVLLQEFLAETEEQLAGVEQALVSLETTPDDRELLQTVFRLVHTFKGNALIVGLRGLMEYAHVVEDVLERLVEKLLPITPETISLLLESVDAFRTLLPQAVAGEERPHPAHARLVEWLESQREGAAAPGGVESGGAGEVERSTSPVEARGRWLRVDVARLDRMLNLMGELTIARGHLNSLLETRGDPEAREALRDSERLFLELQEQVMQTRMVPLGPVFRQHHRTVRDLALSQAKRARLVVEGEDVEVDTAIVEGIRDPLMHMVRNALDHGLEAPPVRRARGKDVVGTLTLRARREAGRLVIEVSDDGGGLGREKLLARARQTGRVGEAEQPPEEELQKLIFEPGFSTAAQVTTVSGRGVGMDVVKRNVEALRGTLTVRSREGEGTCFTLALPLTLAIIDGFAVGVGDQTYVLPLDSVVECVELPAGEREAARRTGVLNLRGVPLPYLRLSHALSVEGRPSSRESVVVIRYQGGQAGLAVDELRGTGQTVVKPLPRQLREVPGVAGSTIQGNGKVALILDAVSLLRGELPEGTQTMKNSTDEREQFG